MGITHLSGPLNVGISNSPAVPGNASSIGISAESPAPSIIFGGVVLQDPRFPYRGGAGAENNALMSLGLGVMDMLVLDAVPSTAVVNSIAVAAATTSGTNFTLVSTTGAGITVLASALQILQTGKVVAKGALAIDQAPALIYFGTCKGTAVPDPKTVLTRAVSITASSGAVGGAFLVTGADLYGNPQTELITAASSPTGATTTNGKKAFKFITAVTPRVTSAFNYSIGHADIVGFPLLSQEFPLAQLGWAGSPVASSAGYVTAVSSTATNTTGDVRGTYTLQSVADGVKVLSIYQTVTPANLTVMSGYFGVTPA